ncbi:uncharacterized protein F54H12.2-like [Mizuhopecten yessoensis]|uniref:uncharacterized protein F54H12.2-like n=1 Tax=Mizuhopecten yessoensis TaxID=6573 RepID=UPI000B457BCF|nr:uncharacterized protein F54H12.2-like [Mizuhopecten yessoensis]
MATINKDFFREAQPSQLEVFELPPTQTAVENVYYQDVLPISQMTGDSPVEFIVSGQNGMEYIDMKNSLVYAKIKIKKADGSNISSTEDIGPVNFLLPALFSQVDVTLQGRTVISTTANYAYKAYIQTLLKDGNGAKTSQLTTQLWHKDTDGEMDDTDVRTGNNLALLERAELFEGGKVVDLEGPIFHDLFRMDRYLLNQVNVNVKMYRSKPEFCLLSGEQTPNYKIEFEDVRLRIAKVKVNPAVIYAQSQTLTTTTAKYPFTESILKHVTLAAGGTSFTYDNIFQGMRPNFITVGFVNATAITGAYNQNPWFFQPFNVTSIGLYVDGIPVGGSTIKLDYDTSSGQTTIPFLRNMFKTTGRWLSDCGLDIDRENISSGYSLCTFNLEPIFQGNQYLTLLKQGNVRLEVTFGSTLSKAISCIVYAEYPGHFEINAARDILKP